MTENPEPELIKLWIHVDHRVMVGVLEKADRLPRASRFSKMEVENQGDKLGPVKSVLGWEVLHDWRSV
jgi:hypothetical protein